MAGRGSRRHETFFSVEKFRKSSDEKKKVLLLEKGKVL
jgi:hypothetical protein